MLAVIGLIYFQRVLSQWVDRTAYFMFALAALIAFVLLFDWVLDLIGPPLWRLLKSVCLTTVHALSSDPEVIRLNERYPRLTGWVRRRLTLSSPSGLYLTLTTLAALYFFGGFVAIARGVVGSGPITHWDPQVAALLTAFRTPVLTRFLWVFTVLGDPRVAFPLTIVAVVLLELWVHRRDAAFIAGSIGGGALIGWLVKLVFERPRPDAALALIATPGSYSFPSSHALYSMLISFSLAFVLARDMHTFRWRLGAFGTAAFFTLLTAVSRVYLGVHWMSDTVAAWLLGAGWLSICIGALTTYERYSGVGRERPTMDHPGVRRRITALIVVAAALFVVWGAQQDPLLARATQPPRVHAWNVTLAPDGTPQPTQKQVDALPRWAENMDGTRMSPIGLIFVGSRRQLVTAFTDAGWQVAEQPNIANVARSFATALADQPYPTAPVTPSFMGGRVHDIAFEKEFGVASAQRRHHTRWWKTNFTVRGIPVWVATASLDEGIGTGPAIGVPTHRIAPDIDAEQRYIVRSLVAGGGARFVERVRVTKPATGTNAAGDAWFTLGMASLLVAAR